MEEVSSGALQTQYPVKTEWNSRCVIFTYFQGDINREVDEHFSRALGLSVNSLQELSPSSQRQEDVILTKEMDLAPNQWRFSSPWTKPQPEASFENAGASCSLDEFNPAPVNPYLITTTSSPLAQPDQQPDQLWHPPNLPCSNSYEFSYPSAFSVPESLVPDPEPQPEEKYESLLNFLQQERCLTLPQQQVSWDDGFSVQRAESSELPFNLPPGSSSSQYACGFTQNSAVSTVGCNTDASSHHIPNRTTQYGLNPTQPLFDKKIYFSPVCEPVSTDYADEKSQMPEMNTDFFFY